MIYRILDFIMVLPVPEWLYRFLFKLTWRSFYLTSGYLFRFGTWLQGPFITCTKLVEEAQGELHEQRNAGKVSLK